MSILLGFLTCLGLACVVCTFLVLAFGYCAATQREDDHYDAHRSPGMGELAGSETPIHDQIVAEVAANAARHIDIEWRLLAEREADR